MNTTLDFMKMNRSLMILMLCVGSVSYVSGASTKFASLQHNVPNDAKGKVYITNKYGDGCSNERPEEVTFQNTLMTGATNGEVEGTGNVPFNVWVVMEYGYMPTTWSVISATESKISVSGVPTSNNTTFAEIVINSDAGQYLGGVVQSGTYPTGLLSIVFDRRQVDVEAGEYATPLNTLSWKNISVDVQATYRDYYGLTIDDFTASTSNNSLSWIRAGVPEYVGDYVVGVTKSEDGTLDITEENGGEISGKNARGITIVRATYTLDTDNKTSWINGNADVTMTLAPANGATADNSNTVTIPIPVDLTPRFDFKHLSTVKAATAGTEAEIWIEVNNFGELPISSENLTWECSFTNNTDNVFHAEVDDLQPILDPELGTIIGGKFLVQFMSSNAVNRETDLTLTAKWKDGDGGELCTFTPETKHHIKINMSDDPGYFIIQDDDTPITSYSTEIVNASTFAKTFAIVDNATMNTDKWRVTSTSSIWNVSIVENELCVESDKLTTAGEYECTIQVIGESAAGTNNEEDVTQSLTFSLKNRYAPITLMHVISTTNSITLQWPVSKYATGYQLQYKNASNTWVDVASQTITQEGDVVTGVVNELTIDTQYTFRLQTTVLDKGTFTSVNTIETQTTINAEDSKWTDMGVDLSSAYQDGLAIMDVLYILNNNECYIYEATPQLTYVLREKINPTTTRAGVVRGTSVVAPAGNLRVYITGSCENLFFISDAETKTIQTIAEANAADQAAPQVQYPGFHGWMQPINCDVYLHNVRLKAAVLQKFTSSSAGGYNYSTKTLMLLGLPVHVLVEADALLNRVWENTNPISASVFYLPDDNGNANTTNFHLLGENYLAGGMGYNIMAKLSLDVKNMNKNSKAYHVISHSRPNYGSAIAIKDASYFTGTPPQIKATFDAVWATGEITDGFLDVSTRRCVEADMGGLTNTWVPEGDNKIIRGHWVHIADKNYRYAPPFLTGGDHGTFEINGGHINLWPANGVTKDILYQEYISQIYPCCLKGGRTTNYLVCGNNEWDFVCTEQLFEPVGTYPSESGSSAGNTLATSGSKIMDFVKSWNNDGEPPALRLKGIGNTYPYGHFIVNGGTISADTYENSFAALQGSTNVADENLPDGTEPQPLFAPNVVVTGGTFQHPLYGTVLSEFRTGYGEDTNGDGSFKANDIVDPTVMTWEDAIKYNATNFRVTNGFVTPESVYRAEFKMDAANKDYSHYMDYTSLLDLPEASVGESEGITIAGLSGTPYRYGMTGVRSDDNNLCWFYFPKDANNKADGAPYSNYYIASGTTVEGCFDIRPYNLTVEKGGIFNEPGDETTGLYHVYGTPKYVLPAGSVTQDQYTLMAMPFDLARFEVKDNTDEKPFSFDAYVETDDNGSADNSNAYCYVYFLDYKEGEDRSGQDGLVEGVSDITTQFTKGYKDEFRMHYHTHTNGLMKRGKTYVVKFPKSTGGDGYWESWPITLVGESNSDVNGANAYTQHYRNERPTVNGHFYMDGNATFAQLSRSVIEGEVGAGQVYLVDHIRFTDDDFYAAEIPDPVPPMQGYLLSPAAFARKYPRLSDYTSDTDVTTGIDATGAEAWKAFATDRHIFVTPVADGDLQVYTVNGELVGTYPIIAGAQTIIPASAGMYILRSGDSVAKVVVP